MILLKNLDLSQQYIHIAKTNLNHQNHVATRAMNTTLKYKEHIIIIETINKNFHRKELPDLFAYTYVRQKY